MYVYWSAVASYVSCDVDEVTSNPTGSIGALAPQATGITFG
jgi:hypothetical protein